MCPNAGQLSLRHLLLGMCPNARRQLSLRHLLPGMCPNAGRRHAVLGMCPNARQLSLRHLLPGMCPNAGRQLSLRHLLPGMCPNAGRRHLLLGMCPNARQLSLRHLLPGMCPNAGRELRHLLLGMCPNAGRQLSLRHLLPGMCPNAGRELRHLLLGMCPNARQLSLRHLLPGMCPNAGRELRHLLLGMRPEDRRAFTNGCLPTKIGVGWKQRGRWRTVRRSGNVLCCCKFLCSKVLRHLQSWSIQVLKCTHEQSHNNHDKWQRQAQHCKPWGSKKDCICNAQTNLWQVLDKPKDYVQGLSVTNDAVSLLWFKMLGKKCIVTCRVSRCWWFAWGWPWTSSSWNVWMSKLVKHPKKKQES